MSFEVSSTGSSSIVIEVTEDFCCEMLEMARESDWLMIVVGFYSRLDSDENFVG